jgi:hypothetical protein
MVEAGVRLCGSSVRHGVVQFIAWTALDVIYYPVYPKAFHVSRHDYGIGFLAWRLHGAAIGHLGV